MTDSAENVKHSTATNNPVGSTKSASAGSAPDSANKAVNQKHSFSRTLARTIQKQKGCDGGHGAHEAIVLKHLAHKVRKSKNEEVGKKWYYATFDELAEKWPYLGRSTIHEVIKRLEDLGYLEIGNFNLIKYDRTLWYHVPLKFQEAAEDDLVYFETDVAHKYGVPSAVLLSNFNNWIGECVKNKVEQRVKLIPARLEYYIPFSASTIKRCLQDLNGKALQKVWAGKSWYKSLVQPPRSHSNGTSQEADQTGQDRHETMPNPANDTHYKPINNPFENHSKGTPSASFDFDQEDDDITSVHSSHTSTPNAAEVEHEQTPPPVAGVEEDMSGPSILGGIAQDKNQWPQIGSYQELRNINQRNASTVKTLIEQGSSSQFLQTVEIIGRATLLPITDDNLTRLVESQEAEELFRRVHPIFDDAVKRVGLQPQSTVSKIIYAAALECVMGSFLRFKINDFYSHSMVGLCSSQLRFAPVDLATCGEAEKD
ncbi:MAG: hypothetical protein QM796_13085 [Chthoniobacteraceae bacterium]